MQSTRGNTSEECNAGSNPVIIKQKELRKDRQVIYMAINCILDLYVHKSSFPYYFILISLKYIINNY